MDLRKISQMQTQLMDPDNFLTILILVCLDTTQSLMASMAPIWRTCQGRRKFKRRGMVHKIAISAELSRVPALATTNTNSKLRLALIVRHTKELRKAYQIIQAIQAFFQSMELPDLAPFLILPRNNQTHWSKQLRLHWSKQTSQQWSIKQTTMLQKFLECNAEVL